MQHQQQRKHQTNKQTVNKTQTRNITNKPTKPTYKTTQSKQAKFQLKAANVESKQHKLINPQNKQKA